MNILFMAEMLAMTEGAGGLFDFNATLPLMAIQFILLTVVLTFVFYKPISKVIDDRETYIYNNETTGYDRAVKAGELQEEYFEQLDTVQDRSRAMIDQSEREAKNVVAIEINDARQEAARLIERTNIELRIQTALTLRSLETQVDELSQLMKKSLLDEDNWYIKIF